MPSKMYPSILWLALISASPRSASSLVSACIAGVESLTFWMTLRFLARISSNCTAPYRLHLFFTAVTQKKKIPLLATIQNCNTWNSPVEKPFKFSSLRSFQVRPSWNPFNCRMLRFLFKICSLGRDSGTGESCWGTSLVFERSCCPITSHTSAWAQCVQVAVECFSCWRAVSHSHLLSCPSASTCCYRVPDWDSMFFDAPRTAPQMSV